MKRRKSKDKKLNIKDESDGKCQNELESIKFACNCGLEAIFPKQLAWYLFAMVLYLRIYYVLQPKNWWLLHPDEVFQSVEVAFSEVYGHGFRTYEYCQPFVNISTAVEEQEHQNGMYSLRSFLYPQFFVAVFSICKYLGLSTNGYLIGRLTQSFISSITIIAVYRMSRTMFRCGAIAFIAAILTSFSLHLSVIGTHTFVNNFVAPFLFFALDTILKYLTSYFFEAGGRGTSNEKQLFINGHNMDSSTHNNKASINTTFCDINSNHKFSESAIKSKPQVVPPLSTQTKEPSNFEEKKTSVLLFTSGLIASTVCYIRPDTSIFVSAFGLSFMCAFHKSLTMRKVVWLAFAVGFGFAAGFLIGGAIDYYTYGLWFLSPIQWSKLNAASHIPTILFGKQSPYQYFYDVFFTCTTDTCINILFAVFLILKMTVSKFHDRGERKVVASLIVTSFVVLMAYSVIGHKELRFIYNVLLLINILSAYAVHGAVQFLNNVFQFSKQHLRVLMISLTILVSTNTYVNFPVYQKNIILPWNTVTPSDSSDINQCLHFISQRSDVSGVFLDGSIYMSAAYSILYHDVPIINLVHREYHEYRRDYNKPRNDLGYKAPKHLRVMNRYSDLIDVSNFHYLIKKLYESLEYNYIVVPSFKGRYFEKVGFKNKLFTAGRFSVIYRSPSHEEKQKLVKTGQNMPIGNDASILEYEGSWLLTTGVYSKAIPRLEHAIKLSDKRIRPFQLLVIAYINMKQYGKAKEMESKCVAKHGKTACRQPQPKLVLHEEYETFEIHQ